MLSRDLFDIKQPGIYVFYAFGGLLFGFNEVGIRLFELVYWLAFSVFALATLSPSSRLVGERLWFRSSRLSSITLTQVC